jgi:hypothetical protein
MKHPCLLCQINEADKSGSHIVPHFLLKRIENIEESKKSRDSELGFVISEKDVTSHFGRSVNPDKLEEVYGDTLEEKISKNQHPLVVDNILCTSCENKLAKLEAEYALCIPNPKYSVEGHISLLFWISIFWRLSINKKSGMWLDVENEEKLRSILSNGIEDLNNNRFDKKIFSGLSYKVIRSINFSDQNPTFLVFWPNPNDPFILFIDEFIVIFSLSNTFSHNDSKDLEPLNQVVDLAKLNDGTSNENTLFIGHNDFNVFNSILLNYTAERKNEYYSKLLDEAHQALGGSGLVMPDSIKQEIFLELTNEEKRLGVKHTYDDFVKTTYAVLSKHIKS